MRVEQQPAYVLHTRNYRDTSLLLELWTPEYGRVAAVARGARNPGKRSQKLYLQAFTPLLVSWTGRSSLKTLTTREASASMGRLQNEYLYSGLYVNELLVRLLPHEDPHPGLYQAYEILITRLLGCTDLEPVLREFEFLLLEELGYGIELAFDAEAGEAITAKQLYCYLPEIGLVPFRPDLQKLPTYRGDCLLAMSSGRYDEEVRVSAKRLLRQALSAQLGDKPLNSRALFA